MSAMTTRLTVQLQSSSDINCLLHEIEECLNSFTSKISHVVDIAAPDDRKCLLEYEEQVQKLKAKKDGLEKLRDEYLQLENGRSNATWKSIKQESLELDRQLLEKSHSLRLTDNSEETPPGSTSVDDYLTDLDNWQKTTLQQNNENINREITQEESLLASLQDLSCLRLIQSEDRLMLIEMQPPDQAVGIISAQETHSSSSWTATAISELLKPLRVKITFGDADVTPRPVAGIEVSVPTLRVEDLLEDARRSDNLHWLLSSVYQRWIKYFRLLEEIEPLRHRYALDWLFSEGIVRVLCGSQSQITCALKLHDDYPTVRNISLQSVTGLPADFNLDTIQIPSNATLGQSLEFLRGKLNQ